MNSKSYSAGVTTKKIRKHDKQNQKNLICKHIIQVLYDGKKSKKNSYFNKLLHVVQFIKK